eukprot:5489433-Pleurochrysis_carterae.AAC.1
MRLRCTRNCLARDPGAYHRLGTCAAPACDQPCHQRRNTSTRRSDKSATQRVAVRNVAAFGSGKAECRLLPRAPAQFVRIARAR